MHEQRGQLRKPERQRLIASLVTRSGISTQHELLRALEAQGCRVTQATISRDLRELGLEKARDPLGRRRYVAPQRIRQATPRETLASVISQFGYRAVAADNIVVVQSELGAAPSIGRALDALGHEQIVGTLAGDDTCLVIARNARTAVALAVELAALIGEG